MRVNSFQVLDINCLIGALVTNANGAEFFIVGLGVDLANHEILVEVQSAEDPERTNGVYWHMIGDWEIQLRPRRYEPGR